MSAFGYLQNQQPRPDRLAAWNSSPVERIRARGGFGSRSLGGRIQPAAASMISGGAKYSIGGRMVAGNIDAAALRCEVVDDEQRILRMKRQSLECVPGGRPGARQVQPIHPGPKCCWCSAANSLLNVPVSPAKCKRNRRRQRLTEKSPQAAGS